MSFETDDASIDDARRREIYLFTLGTLVFRLTSNDTPIVWGGQTYVPSPGLERPNIPIADIDSGGDIQITIGRREALAFQLGGGAALADAAGTVVITRIMLGAAEARQIFAGDIMGIQRAGSFVKVTARPKLAEAQEVEIPRIRASRQCGYQLYGFGCEVDREAGGGGLYKKNTTISAVVSNLKLTVASISGPYSADDFQGGEFVVGNTRRTIMKIVGTTVWLIAPVQLSDVLRGIGTQGGVGVGDSVAIYVGCDRSLTTCDARFSNAFKFGGTPYIGLTPKPFKVRPV